LINAFFDQLFDNFESFISQPVEIEKPESILKRPMPEEWHKLGLELAATGGDKVDKILEAPKKHY